MNTETQLALATATTMPHAPALPATPAQLLNAWLHKQRSPETRRAYANAMVAFTAYVHAPDAAHAVGLLLSSDAGSVHAMADAWKAELESRHAPSTVNIRLVALRNLIATAHRYDLIDWTLDIKNVEAVTYRDTRGPGHEGYKRLAAAARGDTPKAKRDTALIRLLHDNALRSKEVRGLRMEDVDVDGRRVWIVGKGKRQREAVTVAAPTLKALVEWLAVRGGEPGHVFCRVLLEWTRGEDGRMNPRHVPADFDRPISHKSLWELVTGYGKAAGVTGGRPHGLRHQGITRAAEKFNGNLVKIAKYSRHKKLDTVQIYVDHAQDDAGEVAERVAEDD